ncbi:hypothetical protein PGT21_036457 [Puccinia graminis f. sp. tritici]|uniref:Uncharacterized protein n=1 Tax=Puccinia graminis f. sp. tritici TaxID=56615 RepID=A0A5B0R340_PUCGR|nr:hypothetical protein PGT21_036457 [Puccinia graminis f. sp. tritici]
MQPCTRCWAATVKMKKCRQAAASLPGNRWQADVEGSSRPRGIRPPAMKHPKILVGAAWVKPTEPLPSSTRPPEPLV